MAPIKKQIIVLKNLLKFLRFERKNKTKGRVTVAAKQYKGLMFNGSLRFYNWGKDGMRFEILKVAVIIPVIKKMSTANMDLIDNLGKPQSPCPLVHPDPSWVPTPTKIPETSKCVLVPWIDKSKGQNSVNFKLYMQQTIAELKTNPQITVNDRLASQSIQIVLQNIILFLPRITLPTSPLTPKMNPKKEQYKDAASAIVMPPQMALPISEGCIRQIDLQNSGEKVIFCLFKQGNYILFISKSLIKSYANFIIIIKTQIIYRQITTQQQVVNILLLQQIQTELSHLQNLKYQINKTENKFYNDFKKLMNKQNLNVLIFDDQDETEKQEEINRYTGTLAKNGKNVELNGHGYERNRENTGENDGDKLHVITREMQELEAKIKAIEGQGQKLKLQLQKRTTNNTINPTAGTKTTKQIQYILMIVEKKIQLIIQESKKLVNKVTQTVQQRLSAIKNNPKAINSDQINKAQVSNASIHQNNERIKNKLNQIQLATKQKLEQYEQFYKNQYEKLVKQAKRKQQVMMKRLSEMELKFNNKMNTFQTKQKQLVDWIHHLEAKLKQKKTKKMITITQQKPQVTPISNKNSGQNMSQKAPTIQFTSQNNLSSANFQSSRANMSITDQNNSKVVRKHKIFGGTDNSNKSVSPMQKIDNKQSPTKDSFTVPQKGPLNPPTNNSSGPQFYQQPLMNNGSNLNFYNDLKRIQPSRTPQQQQSQRQPQQVQYKFADLNEFSEQYNESQSDDFFAPIQHETSGNYEQVLANIPLDSRGGTYYKQTIGYGYENYHSDGNNNNSNNQGNAINSVQKVFSPFDIN